MPPLPDLNDARDLLEKAKHDLAELKLKEHPYKLFDLLCTLEHINDWIKKDQQFKHLESGREEIHTSSEANTIRLLCNRVKHFRKGGAPDVVDPEGTPWSDGTTWSDGTRWRSPYEVVDIDGEKWAVIELCRVVFEKWEELLKTEM